MAAVDGQASVLRIVQSRPISAPRTASGIGVFCQQLGSAVFAQLYGWMADGTAYPMIVLALTAALLTLAAGATPMALRRRAT